MINHNADAENMQMREFIGVTDAVIRLSRLRRIAAAPVYKTPITKKNLNNILLAC